MTKIRVLFVVAFMAITSLASAQDPMTSTMKKGDKAWTDLENTLRERPPVAVQGKYYKPKRQTAWIRGKILGRSVFENQSGHRHANQSRDVCRTNRRGQDVHEWSAAKGRIQRNQADGGVWNIAWRWTTPHSKCV